MDLNKADNNGKTALHFALQYTHLDIVSEIDKADDFWKREHNSFDHSHSQENQQIEFLKIENNEAMEDKRLIGDHTK